MSQIIEELRRDRLALISALREAGAEMIRGGAVRCPFHEDRNPSGSVYRDRRGNWQFRCHTSTCAFLGDVFDVRARHANRPVEEILREVNAASGAAGMNGGGGKRPRRVFKTVDEISRSVASLGYVEDVYEYANPDTGNPEVVQVRWRDEDGKKHFLTHRPVPGGFALGAPPQPWPLFNRAAVRDAETVVVVEGEKKVRMLAALGIVATCSLSGSENADKADWSPLAGKRVYVWPDKDEPDPKRPDRPPAGLVYAAGAVSGCFADPEASPREMYVVNVEALDLPAGGGVDDFIEAEPTTAEDVWTVINETAEPVGPGGELAERITGLINGTWKSIDWPGWPVLSRSAFALFPGTVTVVCGDPAASKSFWLLQACDEWHRSGTRVALCELEDDKAYHLWRLLAIRTGHWDVLDPRWCAANPKLLRELYETHRAEITSFAGSLHAAPTGSLTYPSLLEFIHQRCAAGTEIVVVDPITALYTGEARARDDLHFITNALAIVREFGSRLILVTHPRTAAGRTSTMDDMAGGRAFSRHVQTNLWLHRHDPAKTFTCHTADGATAEYACNRSLKITKARNGPLHLATIGFSLGDDVRFAEHGLVVRKPSANADPGPDEIPSC
jgi:hypothetical protein